MKTNLLSKRFKTNILNKLNKNKVILIIGEFLIGSASTISSSTLAVLNPGACIIFSSSTTLLTGIAILITHEYISK